MRDPGPSYATVDEISCCYAAGPKLRRQIAKCVLRQQGRWVTILFAFQDRRNGEFDRVRWTLQRWTKVADRWHKDTGINLEASDIVSAAAFITTGPQGDSESRPE